MPGTYQYDVEIKSNVAKLLSDMKQVQDRLDTVEGKEYKIKLNVDEKKLSSVISNLEKMLDSLGKEQVILNSLRIYQKSYQVLYQKYRV